MSGWKKLIGTSLVGGQDYFTEIYRDSTPTTNTAQAQNDGGCWAKSANYFFRGTNIYNLNGDSQGDPVILRMDNNGVIDKYCSVNVTGSGVNGNHNNQVPMAILPISDDEVLQCLRVGVSSSSPWYQTLGNAFAIQKVDVAGQALDTHRVWWWRDPTFYASIFHFVGATRVGADNNFFLFVVRQQSQIYNLLVKINDSGAVVWDYGFKPPGGLQIGEAGGIDNDGTYLYIAHAGEGASPQGSYLTVLDGSGSSSPSTVAVKSSFNNRRNQQVRIAVDAENDFAYVMDPSADGNVTQWDISTPSSPTINWRRVLSTGASPTWMGRDLVPDGDGNILLYSRYNLNPWTPASILWNLNGSDGTDNFKNAYETTSGYTYGKGHFMSYESENRSGNFQVIDGTMYLPYIVRQTTSGQNTGGSLVVPADGSLTSTSAMSVGGSHYYKTYSAYTTSNTSTTVSSVSNSSVSFTAASSIGNWRNSTTNTTGNFIGQSSLGSITQTRVTIS